MNFAESLGPRLLGAEILVRIAQRRDSGLLQWTDSSAVVGIIFVAGRPQVLLQSNGTEVDDKRELERTLRNLSIAFRGTRSFEKRELSDVAHHESFISAVAGRTWAGTLNFLCICSLLFLIQGQQRKKN